MLKKFGVFALTLLLGTSFMLFACGETEDSSTSLDGPGNTSSMEASSENSSVEETPSNLNEVLANATGFCELAIQNLTLETGYGLYTSLGSSTLEEATIDGLAEDGTTKAEITAVGGGQSAIRGSNGAKLHFKNVAFYDESLRYGNRLFDYLEFGGNLRFENCDFKCPIFLKEGTNVEFVNCTFLSTQSDRYAVWVGDGIVSFGNCTFSGYRGLKIHEETPWDVESVTVTDCTFDNLTKKPGLAIGDINVDPERTMITVTGCTFTGCQPWDDEGSKEGIDGFYEADTLTTEFGWTESNNTVDGTTVTQADIERQ